MAFRTEKNRMVWLPDVVKNMTICLFVLTEFTNVTDGRTDRNRQTPHDGIGRACMVSREKVLFLEILRKHVRLTCVCGDCIKIGLSNNCKMVAAERFTSGTVYKKFSCRREAVRRLVSLNISVSKSRSLKVITKDTIE